MIAAIVLICLGETSTTACLVKVAPFWFNTNEECQQRIVEGIKSDQIYGVYQGKHIPPLGFRCIDFSGESS